MGDESGTSQRADAEGARRRSPPLVIGAVVVIVLLLVGSIAAVLALREGSHRFIAIVTFGDQCGQLQAVPSFRAVMFDERMSTMGSGPGVFDRAGCRVQFSFDLKPAERYSLQVTVSNAGLPPQPADGPTFTAERLEALDYAVTIPVTEFGPVESHEIDPDAPGLHSTPDDVTIGEAEQPALLSMNLAAGAAYAHRQKTGSFVGFDPTSAAKIVPNVKYDENTTASEGTVSIRSVLPDSLVLATRAASGTVICFGIDEGAPKHWYLEPAGVTNPQHVSHGTGILAKSVIGVVDAQTPIDCAEGGYRP